VSGEDVETEILKGLGGVGSMGTHVTCDTLAEFPFKDALDDASVFGVVVHPLLGFVHLIENTQEEFMGIFLFEDAVEFVQDYGSDRMRREGNPRLYRQCRGGRARADVGELVDMILEHGVLTDKMYMFEVTLSLDH
jgi:hypothetical protein